MTASETSLEAFIPYRRTDLVELCIEDGGLPADQEQQFREFCAILSAFYHVKSQQILEVLKDSFALFNPDADTRRRTEPTAAEREESEAQLVGAFAQVLQQANYTRLTEDDLQRAFATESLIPLKTSVDFDDYERIVAYYRGDNWLTTTVKRFFRKVEIEVDNLERVALLLKFKPAEHFEAKGLKVDELNFTPGKMYLYLYKNIPRFDLELLFPNVKVSMNLLDRLLFVVPAIGAAVPLLLRVLPSILLIIGVVLLLTAGPDVVDTLNMEVDQEDTRNVLPLLVGALSIGMTLGGFAVKQYNSYKNKRLQFLKKVTDTLFFKNLVTNQGVLYTLVDAAEEEECKEIILVYYHLLTAGQALTLQQLDSRIEKWMREKLDAPLNFDVDKALANLAALQAPMAVDRADRLPDDMTEYSLLQRETDGSFRALPLAQAKAVIDYVWDNIFQYAPTESSQGASVLMSHERP